MPESRKRPGHHEYRKPADIPPGQRIRGRVFVSILMVAFGALIAYFSVGANYPVLLIIVVLSAVIGYYIGKKMEKEASQKPGGKL